MRSVGKTQLINRFVNGAFSDTYSTTRIVTMDNKTVKTPANFRPAFAPLVGSVAVAASLNWKLAGSFQAVAELMAGQGLVEGACLAFPLPLFRGRAWW